MPVAATARDGGRAPADMDVSSDDDREARRGGSRGGRDEREEREPRERESREEREERRKREEIREERRRWGFGRVAAALAGCFCAWVTSMAEGCGVHVKHVCG